MKKHIIRLSCLACLCFAVSAVGAGTIAEDSFETLGDLTYQTGGSGWTDDWGVAGAAGTLTVVSESLGYSDGSLSLEASGGKVEIPNGAFNALEFRSTGTVFSGTVWTGILLQITGTDTSTTNMVSIGHFNGASQFSWIALRAGAVQLHTRNSANTAFLVDMTPYTNGDTVFVVARIQYGAGSGGSDRVDYWVNPDLGAEPTTDDASHVVTHDGAGVTFDRIRISGSHAAADGLANYIDEIRLAPTFAEIVPTMLVEAPVQLVSPGDAETDVPVLAEPTLAWLSGTDENIIKHVLYFSTDENWVSTALPTDSNAIVLDVSIETYQHDETLAYDTTYYWRVDEATGNLNNPSKVETGPVWQFTTESEPLPPLPPCAGLRFDGDIDGDCFVDINDLMLMAQDWLLTSVVSDADISEDTNVNLDDFVYISRDWQTTVEKPNMLFIHAHPDDEGIFGGGTLPYYAQYKEMQVAALMMTTRNRDGSYPMSRGSVSRIQTIRNAMDVYAGQSVGSGTTNGLGHYVTGNITFVESGMIATNCCNADPWGSWSNDDGYAWGISSNVTQLTPGYGNMQLMDDGRFVAAWIIAREIRRFQPEIVVSVHDLEGDYGHENHTASSIALIEAFDLAADANEDIEGLEPWLVSKIYLRGGRYDNRDTIAWDNFASNGGINPLFHGYMEDPVINGESARTIADRGVDQHISEGGTDVSSVFRTGEQYDGHHSEWWTLYRSTVGPDTTSTFTVTGDTTGSFYNGWAFGDFLENIASVN